MYNKAIQLTVMMESCTGVDKGEVNINRSSEASRLWVHGRATKMGVGSVPWPVTSLLRAPYIDPRMMSNENRGEFSDLQAKKTAINTTTPTQLIRIDLCRLAKGGPAR